MEEEEESEKLGCAEVVKDLVAGGKNFQQRRRETERLLCNVISVCAHVLICR